MLDLQRRRVQLFLFVIGLIALSMTAEKFREMVGEEAASKSGEFTFLNCFDMGSGSMACGVKEGVKLYIYSLRSAHVERARQKALEKALSDAITEGLTPLDAAKQAQKIGDKAAKLASRQAKRILGPIVSSGWDFFEAMYFGGTLTEGVLRGSGTLLGTYIGGYHGEERMGKVGYLLGSHLGSWIGGRMGLMVYDVANGLSYLASFAESEDGNSSGYEMEDGNEREETAEESLYQENLDDSRSEGFNWL
ncbi:hypothetical protein LUZ60_013276 [Juncus effusus]|nr:hypothetical protein LUZ60_013276 [Juncus effusus]